MNSYLIEHRIKTLAQLWDKPFTYRGFEFRQWHFTGADGPVGHAWVAKKIVEAHDVEDALKSFRDNLLPIVDRVAFISQCYSFADMEPFVIIRQGNNKDGICFFRWSEEVPGVPLHFGAAQIEALEKLDAYEERGDVFRYLSEATNTMSYYTRLTMLIAALEAMAGEKPRPKGGKATDKEYIKAKILKNDELYDNLFTYGEGLRNRLFHGARIDLAAERHRDVNYIERVYEAIVGYFNKNYDLAIDTSVVNPQRTPLGNYRIWQGWLKPKQPTEPTDIKSLCEVFAAGLGYQAGRDEAEFRGRFELVDMPSGY